MSGVRPAPYAEAKGHVAAQLASKVLYRPTCIRVAGPNAGHTVVNPATGVRHALRQIPVGLVANPDAYGCIAAGSEVDLTVLAEEIEALEKDDIQVRTRLSIDPSATVLEPRHIQREHNADLSHRIGSTGKGIGAARADRIMRGASTIADYPGVANYCARVEDVVERAMIRERDIQIEGTQGYMLGLHTQYYPQVTSSDCTALDFLAMARVNPWMFRPEDLSIWVVYRPYPIRVAGNSGPMQGETSWEALGLEPELTTVTKKVRRVAHWNGEAAHDALRANRGWAAPAATDPIRLALTMADQLDPALAGSIDRRDLLNSANYQRFLQAFIENLGRAPDLVTTSDRTAIFVREED